MTLAASNDWITDAGAGTHGTYDFASYKPPGPEQSGPSGQDISNQFPGAGEFLNSSADLAKSFASSAEIRQRGQILQQRQGFRSDMMRLNAREVQDIGQADLENLVAQMGADVEAGEVSFAAQGVDVASSNVQAGSAQTRSMYRTAAINHKANIFNEAWGLETSAEHADSAAAFEAQQASRQATTTIITSIANAGAGLGKMVAKGGSMGAG